MLISNHRISKLVEYYTENSNEVSDPLRYSFDNLLIGNEEAQIAKRSFLKTQETLMYGEDLKKYQKNLSQYIGTEESQLLLFYTAHGALSFVLEHIKNTYPHKNEVVLSAFTCTVVVNAVTAAGLKPVFIDIQTDTYGLDILNLKEILKERKDEILCVITQHLFGFVSKNYQEIVDLCKSYNILTVGDCAPSLGALYKGKSIGLLEDFAIFSSQASKSINTYTGGILVINKDIRVINLNYEKLEFPDIQHLRSILEAYYLQYLKKTTNKWYLPFFLIRHKSKFISSVHPLERNDNDVQGLQAPVLHHNKVYIRRFPNVLAMIGLIQLSKLETFIKRRTAAKDYILANFGGKLVIEPNSRPAFLRIPIMKTEEYKKNVGYEKNYLVGKWFPYYFGDCPNAKAAAKKLVNYTMFKNYDDIK